VRRYRHQIVVVRHGETAWTISGRHTSRTDVPLTEFGRRQAQQLAPLLTGREFGTVLASPRQRAVETCRLAGYGNAAEWSDEVVEWDYGAYEGRTAAEIRKEVPGWSLWRDGVPDGETAAAVGTRADRVIDSLQHSDGDALVFSHGHFVRVLAARWIGLEPSDGRCFALDPASISVLGWEREQPVITRWNTTVPLATTRTPLLL
jgi:probable phosphoglycerate mutase